MKNVSCEKLLLTEIEAAQLLSYAPITLSRLRKAGKIGYHRHGRTIRYSPEQLAAWKAANAQGVRTHG